MIRSLARIAASLLGRPAPPTIDAREVLAGEAAVASPSFNGGSKPYVRWWWLAGPFRREDISAQLAWVRSNGFGGVELAWLWPSWLGGARPGIAWLGPEWADLVAFAKQEADRLGLGCDFTFGSCWPFGGSVVPLEDASQTFDGPSRRRLIGSWEEEALEPPLVLNHLDRGALRRYAESMMPAFAGALRGSRSALFCDSLEVDTRGLWDPKLWDRFAERFGYRLEGMVDRIDEDPRLLYDYRTAIAEAILGEFYREFAAICRENGAASRVQCHGAPTDLLSAYAAAEIPESESILFDPPFSRIAASAAALSGKPVVSAETFTCLYGFATLQDPGPYRHWHEEQPADLKLLADALFAQGINQIVWHGMPFNPPGGPVEFYASVHIGPDSGFAAEIPRFNAYLERVSALMKLGRPESRLAVYLPNEDNRILGRIPEAERTPGANYRWEMRHVVVPREAEGYAPLWISGPFLRDARVADGRLCIGDCSFSALMIDVEWLDGDALADIARLAEAGLPIILRRDPKAPGMRPRGDYPALLDKLLARPNVARRLDEAPIAPLVAGDDLPPFWCRRTDSALSFFFAHPKARELRYPMRYGQSLCRKRIRRRVVVDSGEGRLPLDLTFEPCQSLLVRIARGGKIDFIDLEYLPPAPTQAALART